MDCNNQSKRQKKRKKESKRQKHVVEAKDWFSVLPDSIIHHILSFLDIKRVAQTSLLSKRWKHIWISIPALVFPCDLFFETETSNFMEFVDRTLLLHDTSSNIQKAKVIINEYMSASRVQSWIESLKKLNVEELELCVDQDEPFFIPISLFTCESLVQLELAVNEATHLPRSFCLPKLMSLKLCGVQFTDDGCWNEQHFSSCPVLEKLCMEDCAWFGVRKFCISTPALKLLVIDYDIDYDDGLQNCAFTIDAPNLVSLVYHACVAKEYVFSSFESLEHARVFLICEDDAPMNQSVSKFVRALCHVQRLDIHAESLQALSVLDSFVNVLSEFHYLEKLFLKEGETTDESVFTLLKAVPNLRRLTFDQVCLDENEEEHSWADHMLTAGCMFQYLESVTFVRFVGNARQMKWVKLILKNAKALKAVKLRLRRADAKNKKVLESELVSLPRASDSCKFRFVYLSWSL